jgi:hypothetical protein
MDINIESQIVVKTAAQWAINATVYSEKRILVTSDAYYGSTDFRKFKIADGVQTWANLQDLPFLTAVSGLAAVLGVSASTGDIPITSPDGNKSVAITDLTVNSTASDGGSNYSASILDPNFCQTEQYSSGVGGFSLIQPAYQRLNHDILLLLDAPDVNLANETASRILSTDASKNIKGLSTATYPSLSELAFLKGVTSAIQTQINTKQATLTADIFGTFLDSLASKATPVNADTIPLKDSADTNDAKEVSLTDFKAFLKTYFDTLYQVAGTYLTSANIVETITNGDTTHASSSNALFDALALKEPLKGSDDNYVTDAQLVVIGNTSGTNTGDQDLTPYQKLVTPTTVKTSNYTVVAYDLVPVDVSGGTVVLTLPSAPADKTIVAIKQIAVGTSAQGYVTTINCAGSDVFNKAGGATTGSMSVLNQSIVLQYKSSTAIWYAVSNDIPLSETDIRYVQSARINGRIYAQIKIGYGN